MAVRRSQNLLSALTIKHAKPGRHADGQGLYLVVDPSGAKRWLLRIVVHGRRRDIGLGSASLVSLSEAREQALSFRKRAREGGDPVAERRSARVQVPTFEEAATRVHEDNKTTWRNPKHKAQWISTLQSYAFPLIGTRPVDQISTPDVLQVLSPIWLTKAETARRVRQRIATVLDWAKAAGHRTGDNPVDGVGRGLPKQPDRQEHHAAMPYAEVPAFVQNLRISDSNPVVRLAFEFLILTATRTGEVLGARWDEIDLSQALWTIPAARMKAGREHRVPLAPRSIAILKSAAEMDTDGILLFPGRASSKPLSDMVFTMLLRRAEVPFTSHGFRSSFRDWASETTSIPHEVAEMALAHTIKNKVEAAYRRGDLLDKRRQLMVQWADYVTKVKRTQTDGGK